MTFFYSVKVINTDVAQWMWPGRGGGVIESMGGEKDGHPADQIGEEWVLVPPWKYITGKMKKKNQGWQVLL